MAFRVEFFCFIFLYNCQHDFQKQQQQHKKQQHKQKTPKLVYLFICMLVYSSGCVLLAFLRIQVRIFINEDALFCKITCILLLKASTLLPLDLSIQKVIYW